MWVRQLFVVSPILTWQREKRNFFTKSGPSPFTGRKPQTTRPQSPGACHTVTHLNFKTSAFSFKFCHFVVTVFLTQFHTMTQCCIVNAIQRIHRSSHELGMLMLSRFSQRAFTTMANKRKTFYSKVEGINQLEKGNLKQRGTQHSAGRGQRGWGRLNDKRGGLGRRKKLLC